MRLVEISEAASFLNRTSRFLLQSSQSEAENNLLFSSAFSLAKTSATRSPRLSFFVVEDENEIVCAALNSVERRLLLSSAREEAAAFLARELKSRGTKLKSVLGPEASSNAFCTTVADASTSVGTRTKPQLVYRLEKLAAPPANVSGWARMAKSKDLKLLIDWSREFVEECEIDESPGESEEVVRRYLEAGQIYLWEDSRPVAMAGYGGQTPNGMRVSMVFTAKDARCKGFAGSLVHGVSRRLLASGKKYCFLYADATDPVANKVYERLGYRPVGRFAEHRL